MLSGPRGPSPWSWTCHRRLVRPTGHETGLSAEQNVGFHVVQSQNK